MSTSARRMSNYQLRQEGWEALTERLGVSGAMRFLMQYDTGHGDYTRDRKAILESLESTEITEELRNMGVPARYRRRRKT